ncbi:hypothetical protein K439DRAFT_1625210 [Ramaria rubella]|nr:hypothetical protein K439DRAFT_1625210 [Ramaria rubella]
MSEDPTPPMELVLDLVMETDKHLLAVLLTLLEDGERLKVMLLVQHSVGDENKDHCFRRIYVHCNRALDPGKDHLVFQPRLRLAEAEGFRYSTEVGQKGHHFEEGRGGLG